MKKLIAPLVLGVAFLATGFVAANVLRQDPPPMPPACCPTCGFLSKTACQAACHNQCTGTALDACLEFCNSRPPLVDLAP